MSTIHPYYYGFTKEKIKKKNTKKEMFLVICTVEFATMQNPCFVILSFPLSYIILQKNNWIQDVQVHEMYVANCSSSTLTPKDVSLPWILRSWQKRSDLSRKKEKNYCCSSVITYSNLFFSIFFFPFKETVWKSCTIAWNSRIYVAVWFSLAFIYIDKKWRKVFALLCVISHSIQSCYMITICGHF